MKFRLAQESELQKVVEIYERILDDEEAGHTVIGWERGVYPTFETARSAFLKEELYVALLEGAIVASAIINTTQVDVYEKGSWQYDVEEEKVFVLHTLTVDPLAGGKGIGRAFVDFYEKLAIERGRPYLRLDTNAKNARARKMYKTLGYEEIGIVDTTFNGIAGVKLVLLEKALEIKS